MSAHPQTIDELSSPMFEFFVSVTEGGAVCPHCSVEMNFDTRRNIHVEKRPATSAVTVTCTKCYEEIGTMQTEHPLPIVETITAIEDDLGNVMSDSDISLQRERLDRIRRLLKNQL